MKSAIAFIGQIFRSKAFGFLAVLFVAGTVLLIIGKLAGNEWLQLMQWLGGGAVARSAIGDFSTQKAEIEHAETQIQHNVAAGTDTDIATDIVHSTDKR